MFQFFLGLSKQQLQETFNELKATVPAPMNTMLDKQPREEAIRKRMERSSMVTKDVPPTAAGTHQNGNIRSFTFTSDYLAIN